MRRSLLHHDGKPDGGDHKNYRAPDGEACEQVGCRAGAEGGLRTRATKGSGKIRTFSLLKQNNTYEHETYDDVNYDEQINHGIAFLRDRSAAPPSMNFVDIGAEGGT